MKIVSAFSSLPIFRFEFYHHEPPIIHFKLVVFFFRLVYSVPPRFVSCEKERALGKVLYSVAVPRWPR